VHELSLSRAVISTALEHADGRRVAAVSLQVGRLRQVVPGTLEFYFEFAARGTPCEGAHLDIEVVEVRLRCNTCGEAWDIEIPDFRCRACGGPDVSVTAGDEFQIESIEVEEDACTAHG
jgi:hydrogenase nickel incorporation protein HypA/HybF